MKSLNTNSALALLGLSGAVLLGGFAACTASATVEPVVTNEDGGNQNDGNPSADSNSNVDGGDSGGTTPVSTGYVNFTQGGPFALLYSNSASASFYVLPAGYNLTCAGYKTTTVPTAATAGCVITVCTDPGTNSTDDAGTTADAAASIAPNTGDITLKSALDTTGVLLTAKTDGTYTPASATTQWWAPGDGTIDVKSNGSTSSIAAFDDTALVGPGDVTSPTFNETDVSGITPTTVKFDRGTALAVKYSGGTAATKLNVQLSTTSTAQKSIISCDFDAANGEQSVAAADLGHLQMADGSTITGAYSLQARSVKATTSGNFTFNVTLGATSHAGTFTNTN